MKTFIFVFGKNIKQNEFELINFESKQIHLSQTKN